MTHLLLFIAVLLAISAGPRLRPWGQEPGPSILELQSVAEARQRTEDWAGAIEVYRHIVTLDAGYKKAWLELGLCALTLGDHQVAIDASRRAAQLGGRDAARARFHLARALALSGKLDAALAELDRALDEAVTDIRKEIKEEARTLTDFEKLREDPRFARMLTKSRPEVELPPELPSGPMGWAYWEPGWVKPEPSVVRDKRIRAAIESTGLPWRVRDRLFHIEFVLVPPGTCIEGSSTVPPPVPGRIYRAPNNTPRHKVTISAPFYLARYELSFPEWDRIMGNEPSPERLEDALTAELTRSVLASVVKAGGSALPPADVERLAPDLAATIEDLLRPPATSGDLRAPSSSKWWETVAEAINGTVAKFMESRDGTSSTSTAGAPVPAATTRSSTGSAKAMARAVGDGISKFVQERGSRDAFPKHWFKVHNLYDDQTQEAWRAVQEVLAKAALVQLRLPTEAEWEYAARLGGKPKGARDLSTYRENFRPVDKAPQSDGLGLYNLLGSAAEWCSDYYVDDAYTYLGRASVDPHQAEPASAHCFQHFVLRGCSEFEVRDTACQQYRRLPLEVIGIRLARSAAATSSSSPYVHPDVEEFDAPPLPMAWAEVIEELPDPAFVTDERLRAAIVDSGFPWRVKDRMTHTEMLLVPPGTYTVGHPFRMKELQESWVIGELQVPRESIMNILQQPARDVTIERPFYLARFERPFDLGNSGALATSQTLDLAAGLRDAERIIGAQGFRLPTDLEWEVACRAGTTGHFYGPLEEITWRSCPSMSICSHTPQEKKPNPLGFYGMIGAHAEPCLPTRDPAERVYRGGACGQEKWQCSAWYASREPRSAMCGLRVAREP